MADPSPSHRRNQGLLALKLVGLIVLVVIVLYRFDLDTAKQSFRGMDTPTALFLIGIFLTSLSLRIYKWGYQMRSVGLSFQWLPMVRSYLLSILLGVVTPMRVGEIYRLATIEFDPNAQGERALAVASLVLEKIYELIVLLVLATFGLFFSFSLPWLGAAAALGCAALVLYTLAPLAPPVWAQVIAPTRLWDAVARPMLRARDELSNTQRLSIFAMSVMGHLVNLAGGLVIFRLFGDISATDFFFRLPVVALVNAAPITISGIGLRELGAMEIFGPLGFPESGAAAAAALLFICVNLIPLVMMPPVLLLEQRARKKGLHPKRAQEESGG